MNILLTGVTGFVGRRLLERMHKETNVRLRLFVPSARPLGAFTGKSVEVVEGDTFNREALDKALKGIHTAYYLIHSMASKEGDFEDLDRKSAENFRDACIRSGVKRIVYLGGLGKQETASRHLRSRLETGEILSARPDALQTIWFRASIIIGSGGASFEIIRPLVQKLPIMLAPRWVRTITQPIGIADVLEYLAAARKLRVKGNLVVDIGAEKISFRDMLLVTARGFGLKRLILPVPFFSPKLSSYWLVFITPVPFPIASALIEGLKSETVLMNENAKRYFPEISPRSFATAIGEAVAEIERDQVVSRWCDGNAGVCFVRDVNELRRAVFSERGEAVIDDLPSSVIFSRITAIGGDQGWYSMNVLWRIRGFIDTLAGGPGIARGRRTKECLRIGDALDFWKVIDLVENERLLLLSQMRLPGKAWLEFVLHAGRLLVTGYFMPKGLWGRMYWYALYPFHKVLFRRMAKNIVARAKRDHNEKNALCSS